MARRSVPVCGFTTAAKEPLLGAGESHFGRSMRIKCRCDWRCWTQCTFVPGLTAPSASLVTQSMGIDETVRECLHRSLVLVFVLGQSLVASRLSINPLL